MGGDLFQSPFSSNALFTGKYSMFLICHIIKVRTAILRNSLQRAISLRIANEAYTEIQKAPGLNTGYTCLLNMLNEALTQSQTVLGLVSVLAAG